MLRFTLIKLGHERELIYEVVWTDGDVSNGWNLVYSCFIDEARIEPIGNG